jgi:cytochrome b involved in lipid metabolism
MYTDNKVPEDAMNDLRAALMKNPGDLQTFEDNMMGIITQWVMTHSPEMQEQILKHLPPGFDPTRVDIG